MPQSPRFLAEKLETILALHALCAGEAVPPHPTEIFIEVSNVCDLRCTMCVDFSGSNPNRAETIKAKPRGLVNAALVLDGLDDALRHALSVHCFGGGEPTIHPDFRRIVKHLADHEVLIDFFTNGMHLDDDLADFLVEAGVYKVTVSISGTTREEYQAHYLGGDFDRVLAGMRRITAHKRARGSRYPILEVNSLGFRNHVAQFETFVERMAECGANVVHLKKLLHWPHVPHVHDHVSVMRPWIEGPILERAIETGRRLGVVVSCDQYLGTAVATEEEYCSRMSDLQAEGAAAKEASSGPLGWQSKLQVLDARADEASVRDLFDIRKPIPQEADVGDFYCMEPFKTLFLTRNGTVRPCCFHGSWHLGNVAHATATEIWRGTGYRVMRDAIIGGEYPMRLCGPCLAKGMGPRGHGLAQQVGDYFAWHQDRFGPGLTDTLARRTPNVLAEFATARSDRIAAGLSRKKGAPASIRWCVDAVGTGTGPVIGLTGWACHETQDITSLSVVIEDGPTVPCRYGVPRPDVAAALRGYASAAQSGFVVRGVHGCGRLSLEAELADGRRAVVPLGTVEPDGTFRPQDHRFNGAVIPLKPRPSFDFSHLGALLRACGPVPRPLPPPAADALVIAPVYGGLRHLRPFFKSLLANTIGPCRIAVVDDGNSDPEVLSILSEVEGDGRVTLVRQQRNCGYVEAITAGFALWRSEHVVVVNTDTVVPPGWLERLLHPLEKDAAIASATPLSDCGSICGFPFMPDDNLSPPDPEAVDAALRRIDPEAATLPIPTGIGFCMAMSRHALARIGFIERETFGAGYGEENDWCRKAVAAGFTNVLVPNLFVRHAHGGSFPTEQKRKLMERNLAIVNRRYPDYQAEVAELILADPLAELRAFVAFVMAAEAHPQGALLVFSNGHAAPMDDTRPTVHVRFDADDLRWIYQFSSTAGRFVVAGGNFAELEALALRVRTGGVTMPAERPAYPLPDLLDRALTQWLPGQRS